jgi:hypothetical protein
MSTFEAVIAFIIIGLLVVWFCIYLWRDIRDRSVRQRSIASALKVYRCLWGLSTTGITSIAQKNAPTGGRLSGHGSDETPFGDEEGDSVTKALCPCCADFRDRRHFLHSKKSAC